jgi:hypothetical protein
MYLLLSSFEPLTLAFPGHDKDEFEPGEKSSTIWHNKDTTHLISTHL